MVGRLSMLPTHSSTQSAQDAAGVVGAIGAIGAAGAASENGIVYVAGDVALVANVVAGVVRFDSAVAVKIVVSAASVAASLAVAGVVGVPDVAGLDESRNAAVLDVVGAVGVLVVCHLVLLCS